MRSCCIAQGTISICMYVRLGHFAVQQKLTEHCKSTIVLKKKIHRFNVTRAQKMKGRVHQGESGEAGSGQITEAGSTF